MWDLFQVLSYNRANRAVAVLCNHQRAVPKTHEKSMENLKIKIDAKKDAIDKAEKEFKVATKHPDSSWIKNCLLYVLRQLLSEKCETSNAKVEFP